MKAWQFTGTGKPLQLDELEIPQPGPGQVLLKVGAAGLCQSDVRSMYDVHGAASLVKTPITLGHEIAGTVRAVGDGVIEWKTGDRVGVCPTASAGTMGSGGPAANEVSPGYGHDGGFAEYYLGSANDLVRIPDEVGFTYGAVATDAGMTSYHALVVRGALKAGMKVGIIGIGGLGQIAARVGVLLGAEVHVAEPKESAWDMAHSLGVTDVVADATEWAGVGFDLIVDYAGFGSTTGAAIKAVRFDGTVVQVGLARRQATVDTTTMVVSHVNYLGSIGGTKEDIAALYQLMKSGELAPETTEISFDEIPDGLGCLRAGKVAGRLVARL